MENRGKTYTDKAKKVVEETAAKTYKATAMLVKIIFIVIIVCTVFVTIWQYFFVKREQFLTDIATISVAGFWAFFLGYFGWRMGQTIEVYFLGLKKKNN
jgi:hypothetical protein